MASFFIAPTTNDSLKSAASAIPGLLLKSIAGNTVKKYAQGFRTWNKWRRDHPELSPPLQLAVFIAANIQSNSRNGRIDTVCCGLAWLHKTLGLPNPCDSGTVQALKEAAKRTLSNPVRKKEPLTPRDMKKLAEKLRNKSLPDLRTLTVGILSYAGFLRFDEVSTIRSELITFYISYVKLFIPQSKTDQHCIGDYVLIAKTRSSTCPVNILKSYLHRANVGSRGFIFRAMQKGWTNQ